MTFVIYGIVLGISHSLHGAQIYLDATLLPLGIIGQVLMTYGYRSQWIAWIVLDVINVIIWTRALQADPSAGATSMLALQIMMLINSFYGQYMWLKSHKPLNKKATKSHLVAFLAEPEAKQAADDYKNN